MLTALLLKRWTPDEAVVLVEHSPHLGGLLGSFDYGAYGRFDHAVHMYPQTGVEELDRLPLDLIPEDEWVFLKGDRRERAGLYHHGRLKTDNPFVDLRDLPDAVQRACLADFMLSLNQNRPFDQPVSAADVTRARFGSVITEEVIAPVMRRVYRRAPEEMHPMALRITPLDRVAFFAQDVVEDVTTSPSLRARIAYTDQRRLPLAWTSGLGGLYPKKFGMQTFVDAFEARLDALGVRILKNTSVAAIKEARGYIHGVDVKGKEQETTLAVDHLYWTAGLFPLMRTLHLEKPQLPTDPPMRTVIVLMLLEKQLDMGDLDYFYAYDDGLHTYRVNNYYSYCPDARRPQGYPFSQELFMEDDEVASIDDLAAHGLAELRQMGVLHADNPVTFTHVEIPRVGFPRPTLRNMAFIKALREAVADRGLQNFMNLGVMSEEGVFYQNAVMARTYFRMQEQLQAACRSRAS